MVLLDEEAKSRKVPCWLDPQGLESQFPVDTEKFNNRWPFEVHQIWVINS
jgi:midasin